MKGDKDFLISIDDISNHPFKFKKYELYKCDILIVRVPDYKFCRGYKHVAELKIVNL